jgi:alpha-glucosidase
VLGDGSLRWVDGPPGALFFERDGAGSRLVCAVNLGADAVPLPEYDEVLLASAPLDPDGRLPSDTAVWLRLG